jgi:hypothetical protein
VVTDVGLAQAIGTKSKKFTSTTPAVDRSSLVTHHFLLMAGINFDARVSEKPACA